MSPQKITFRCECCSQGADRFRPQEKDLKKLSGRNKVVATCPYCGATCEAPNK